MEGILAKTGNDYILYSKDNSVLGITSGTIEGRKLSLHNCEDIERGYNLDVLAEERTKNQLIRLLGGEDREEVLDDIKKRKFYFIEGAKAILEILGDKMYTESHMAYMMAKTCEFVENHLDRISSVEFFNNTIKSLQPKEWDVEIQMENKQQLTNGYKNQPDNVIGFIAAYENVVVPKLDDDGCLILRRI